MKKLFTMAVVLGMLVIAGSVYAYDPPADTVSIYQIQMGLVAQDTTYFVDSVIVTGLGESGVWVQEPGDTGTAFSGIFCYASGPYSGVHRGDLVNIIGYYHEYNDWSELNVRVGNDGEIFVIGSGVVPTPPLLTCCDINDSLVNTEAEKWEGVLVKIDTVKCTANDLSYGYWSVVEADADAGCAVQETLFLDDEALATVAPPPVDTVVASITGVVDFTYGQYKLIPRDNYDIVYRGLPPAPGVQYAYPIDDTHLGVVFNRELDQTSAEVASNYYVVEFDITINSATMNADEITVVLETSDMSSFAKSSDFRTLRVQNIANKEMVPMTTPADEEFIPGVKGCWFAHMTDSATVYSRPIAVACVVTGEPLETNYDEYMFMQDRYADTTAFGFGLMAQSGSYFDPLFHPEVEDVERGDSVIISGTISHYYGMIELALINNIKICTKGVGDPVPLVVTLPQVHNDSMEGKLLKIEGVTVARDTSIGYGVWSVHNLAIGTDTVGIDDYFYPGIRFQYDPTVGDSLHFIVGPMAWDWYHYKLMPRDTRDIHVHGITSVSPGDAPRFVNNLDQNRPNPFNPTTTISFTIEKPSFAILKIFDVAGRHVRTLHKGDLPAGTWESTWDGRSNSGKSVVSGVYFYRLEASDYTSTKKMMLVR